LSGDGVEVGEQRAFGSSPHAFAENAGTGCAGEQARRQQLIVDLVGFRAVAEGSEPVFIGVAVVEGSDFGDVGEVGIREQWLQGSAVRCVVEIA